MNSYKDFICYVQLLGLLVDSLDVLDVLGFSLLISDGQSSSSLLESIKNNQARNEHPKKVGHVAKPEVQDVVKGEFLLKNQNNIALEPNFIKIESIYLPGCDR